jgi:hypothetical protein
MPSVDRMTMPDTVSVTRAPRVARVARALLQAVQRPGP